MTSHIIARLSGGVATYQEEDRGDELVSSGAAGGIPPNKTADELAAKAEEEAKAGAGEAKDEEVEAKAEDEEAKAADKRAQEKAEREKNIAVPKARFDQAVAKEREAREKVERELAELKAAREASADVKKLQGEIDTLQEDLDKALADNNPAEKKRLRAEIRAREEALIDARVSARSALARAEAVEQVRYDSVVDRVEEDYPFLAEGAEDFDADLTQAMLVMKRGYEADGLSSSEALKRTVRTLKPQLDAAKKARAGSGDGDAAAAAAAAAKDKAADAEAKRKEKAVAAGAAAAKSQPAGKPGVAGTADKTIKTIDVTKLSEKDFDKLPDEELKRLRGDSV